MIKLLVVDDEEGICEFMSDFFTRRGHEVFTATNPLDVMPILEKEKPQIMLLDILMPNMSGLDLLKQIRDTKRETNAELKVIMVTVADDPEVKAQAFSLGANEYIHKPFSTDYLESVVMSKIQELVSSLSEQGPSIMDISP